MISEAEQHIGRITRLERRLDRERRARQEAETLLEARALALQRELPPYGACA